VAVPDPAVLSVAVFALTYIGMALGRVPGLKLDRTGIALIAAITLYAAGAVTGSRALQAVDFATIAILFGLMILSAQFALSGFYDWVALRIAQAQRSPAVLLAATVAVSGALSAVLVNDVVVFAMVPLLVAGLQQRGLDPRPFLIALAGGANAGSAATIVGNPQNILIGEVGRLHFWDFTAACGAPAILALVTVFLVIWIAWRKRFAAPAIDEPSATAPLDRWQLIKACIGTAALLILFGTAIPREMAVLLLAGVLLVSRTLHTRQMLGLVDYQLLVLFGGLFIVTDALAATRVPADFVAMLQGHGLTLDRLAVLAPVALAASNTIGNVPAVVLILSAWPDLSAGTLYGLAVLSTLSGNLFLVGSVANLIVVERARTCGVHLGFAEHARCGVPMALISMALAAAWLSLAGHMN
jgi:Na+/H+ antiporter NhaD/arsenite permease-like protein